MFPYRPINQLLFQREHIIHRVGKLPVCLYYVPRVARAITQLRCSKSIGIVVGKDDRCVSTRTRRRSKSSEFFDRFSSNRGSRRYAERSKERLEVIKIDDDLATRRGWVHADASRSMRRWKEIWEKEKRERKSKEGKRHTSAS